MSLAEEYPTLDALGLAQAIRKGELSPQEVLECAIARAEELDPKINAIVDRMYDLARRSLASVPRQAPLAGVPYLLKDLNVYVQGTPTTNGCRFYRDHVADHDSEIVKRYRAAGLVLFGKTASPEFGLTTTTESVLFGQTRNPWSLEHTSGGSSGGAAAAVAARIVPAAHASDGGGSIRVPASCCGLFGLKPSRGRVSLAPDAGEGWGGLSTVHAVSVSVRDSAALLDAAAGPVPGDPYWAPPPSRPYLEEVGAPTGRLRIAMTTEAFNGVTTHPECVQATHDAARLCEELGHELVETSLSGRWGLPSQELGAATGTLVGANILANLRTRAQELGRDYTEKDVEPVTLNLAESSRNDNASDYALAVRTVHRVGRQVAQLFTEYDVLLTPTLATPPKKLGALALTRTDGEAYLGELLDTIAFTQLMNVAGNPAASVPLRWSDQGLPVGVQFAAAYGREDTLFRLAAQLEEARPWRDKRPRL